jgi:hypothetical protein
MRLLRHLLQKLDLMNSNQYMHVLIHELIGHVQAKTARRRVGNVGVLVDKKE